MVRWLWASYLAAGVALAIAYELVPSLHQPVVFNVVCLSSPIAILVGIRIHHPARRLPWLLFAAGQSLFVAGDMVTYNYTAIFGTEIPFPSVGHPIYLAVYPCLIGGLLLIVRNRMPGRDLGSLIDSVIIAISAGTVSCAAALAGRDRRGLHVRPEGRRHGLPPPGPRAAWGRGPPPCGCQPA